MALHIKGTTSTRTLVIQTQGFSRHFLKNEQSKPATARKTTDLFVFVCVANDRFVLFVANDKIRAFR